MALFDYTRPLATANRLIEKFGQTGALRKEGALVGEGFDPVAVAPTFSKVVLVDLNRSIRSIATDNRADKTLRVFYIRALEGVTPVKGDQIMLSGATAFLLSASDANFIAEATVDTVSPLSPAGTVLFYEVGLEL